MYKVLTTTQPSYLYNLISVQSHRSTHSSDVVTLSLPPSSSSLKVNNRSFRHSLLIYWTENNTNDESDVNDDQTHVWLISISTEYERVN